VRIHVLHRESRRARPLPGMLDYAHALGTFTNFVAMTIVILALLWGGYLLYLQYQNLDRRF
jgi:hypothetical protein